MLTAKLKKLLQKKESAVWLGVRRGTLRGQKKEFQRKNPGLPGYSLISGCNERLPHLHRYRVVHQMEQLEAGGYTCDTVYFQELKPWMVRCYGAFVIFRCPMTDTLREFATMAKQMNKPLWYDDG